MRFLILISILMICAVPAAAQLTPAQQKQMTALMQAPLFEPALDYSEIPSIDDCVEKTLGPPKYHACRDSRAIYDTALQNATTKGQPLMVIFGFDTCPSCKAMARVAFNPKAPMANTHLVRYLSKPAINKIVVENTPLKISVVRIHSRSRHGLNLADELGATKMAKDRGWHRVWSPFILFVNPQTGKMHSESLWEAEELYCDWGAEFAASLEGVDFVVPGQPYTERKRCGT